MVLLYIHAVFSRIARLLPEATVSVEVVHGLPYVFMKIPIAIRGGLCYIN